MEKQQKSQTIYEKLGDENLTKLVNEFYLRVYSNAILSPLFTNDIDEVKDKQFCFLTQFLGGPQRYNQKYGAPKMRMRHMSHEIDEEARDEWLKCMHAAIETLQLEKSLETALYGCFPKLANHMVNR
jgi:hemoglobin